jgi:carboxyl-terminal processing protease
MQGARGKRQEARGKILASCILLLFLSLACQTLFPTAEAPIDNAPTVVGAPSTDGDKSPEVPTLEPTSTKNEAPISPAMLDRHQRIFQQVWNTVKRHYVYDDYNGVDWSAIKDEFTPLVKSATDDETFWQLMREMIDRLNDRHSAFLSPEEVIEEDQTASGDLDYVGIGILVGIPEEADYAVILFPLPGSPAEAAGIRAHDRIISIDSQIACCNPDGSDNLYLIRGPAGSNVRLVVRQPNGPERELDVPRAHIQSQMPVISRRIDSEERAIGYLLIPTLWDETIAERSREALQALVDAGPLDGIIVDMRINGGGAYTELYDLISLFISGDVGRFRRGRSAGDPLTVVAAPIDNSLNVPLAILIGRDTESFAEIFSGALQAADRATLVGQPTAGNVELIFPYDLEDGSRLWLAEETFEPPSGERWEGHGVQPDVVVPGNWEDFTDEDDPQLNAALDALLELIEQ